MGLRGAVPIVLAAFPVLAGAPRAEHIFDLVFFVLVMSALLPGDTVLMPGDHVYVFAREEDRATIQLLLGRPEQS